MSTAATDFPYRDSDVRPQDDLNRHVNGEWLKTAKIPDDLDAYGSFLELRDKAEADVHALLKDQASAAQQHAGEAPSGTTAEAISHRVGTFFAAFMDAERAEQLGLDPIAADLAKVDEVSSPAELVRLSAQFQRRGAGGLIMAGSVRDAGDPTRELLHVSQDGLGLPDEAYYREDEYAEIRSAYRAHVERFLTIAGEAEPGRAADGVVALETALASHHWDRVTLRDAHKRYNLRTRAEVAEDFSLLDEAIAGWGLNEEQAREIVVGQPDVLTGFAELLNAHDLADWKTWLKLQLLRWAAPLLDSAMVNEHFDFYSKTLSGTPQLKTRWKRAVALTNAHLGEDVGQLYVARHYPANARAAMDDLIAALIEAYRRSISELEWMGQQTREQALAKLDAFTPKIGHPATWVDYSSVQVDLTDSVGNAQRAAEAEWDRDMARIIDGPDPDQWHMTPQTVNAYYHPLENVICFPAAILQPPFFSVERDMAQNFGAIGAVIGHEIGHGFDDQGSKYGADGSLTNWWTDEDRSAFEQRTGALVEQFSSLAPSAAPEHTVNGELTLGENIGDLGGIGIAYQAYRLWLAARNQNTEISAVSGQDEHDDDTADGLTGDQRFFFAWAQGWRNVTRPERAVTLLSIDPHAPAEFRATQPVKNVDAFHRAFGTAPGDGMYLEPAARVTIW